jgi:glycosyltransferase involved in cell wall biosynthesis
MRILVCLTYYRPHISGLTIYVERLSRALVERGHYVTILTSQFDP